MLCRMVEKKIWMLSLKIISIFSFITFFVMMAVCTATSIAQQLDYTQEEIAKLNSYSRIIGQARACKIGGSEEALNKVHTWVINRANAGYPNRGFIFFDSTFMHSYAQTDHPTLTCDEVKKDFDTTEFDLP